MKGPIYRTPREKFLRDVERETQHQEAHEMRVRFTGGKKPHYRAVCSCGWVGNKRPDHSIAEWDADAHEASQAR